MAPELKQKFDEYLSDYDTTEKRQDRADWLNNHKLKELVDVINKILQQYKPGLSIGDRQIRFRSAEISNIRMADESFSDLLFEACFPTPTTIKFSHYSNKKAFANIVSSKTLRLHNLHKDHDDGEFKEFYTDHNIPGYSSKTTLWGIPY